MSASSGEQPAQSVRFSDVKEEIDPPAAIEDVASLASVDTPARDTLSPQAAEELRALSKTLHQSQCQTKRLQSSYVPVSLPPSRVRTMAPTHTSQSTDAHAGPFAIAGLTHAFGTVLFPQRVWLCPPVPACHRISLAAADACCHQFP